MQTYARDGVKTWSWPIENPGFVEQYRLYYRYLFQYLHREIGNDISNYNIGSRTEVRIVVIIVVQKLPRTFLFN